MPFTQVRDLNLYYEYELRGEGPNLLFIGGSGGDLREKPNIFDSPLTDSFTIWRTTSAAWAGQMRLTRPIP